MNDHRARVGIIGCGHWGKNYVRIMSSMPGVRLAAISDIEVDKLARYQKTQADLAIYTNYRELLANGKCNAVVVATIASSHYAIIKDALLAGLDVLAEKPLTLNRDEAEELALLAEKTGRVLLVAHTFLFNPSIRLIKKYISEGTLGEIYYLNSRRTHLGLIREDVNAVWDLAPHDVSVFIYLLEEDPCEIQALGRQILRSGREDVAFINLRFPSGVIGHIHVSWADSNKERFMNFVCSKYRVTFDDLNLQEPVRIFAKGVSVEPDSAANGFGEFKYLYRDGDIVSPKVIVQEPLRVLCENFIEAMETRGSYLSDGRFGARVVGVLERIEEAIKKV